MTKAELIRFLEPFTDEIELYIWSDKQGTWRPLEAKAEYSGRTGRTSIWCKPKAKDTHDPE